MLSLLFCCSLLIEIMNPFLEILQEALRNKVILLMLGISTGVATDESLPFLAKSLNPKVSEGRVLINSARKERVALQSLKDSINRLDIYSNEEIVNRKLDEEVNRSVDTFTDVQLDSILAGYKHTPFTKK